MSVGIQRCDFRGKMLLITLRRSLSVGVSSSFSTVKPRGSSLKR